LMFSVLLLLPLIANHQIVTWPPRFPCFERL